MGQPRRNNKYKRLSSLTVYNNYRITLITISGRVLSSRGGYLHAEAVRKYNEDEVNRIGLVKCNSGQCMQGYVSEQIVQAL